jgi:hypothetical protein
MNIVDALFLCIEIKENEDNVYSPKTSSVWSKTHVGDLKDGTMLIPFTECLWVDTCLPNFKISTK